MLLLFVIYLISAASVTIAPLHAVDGVAGYVNLTPVITQIDIIKNGLRDHSDMSIVYENLYGNILLFMPIGFFIPLLTSGRFAFIKVFLVGFVGSCFIEWMQWVEMHWHYYRTADIDDVILNTLGACLGFLLYKLLQPLIQKIVF